MRNVGLGLFVLLGLFILNIWMENASSSFYGKWIEPILNAKITLATLVLIGAAVYYLINLVFQNKDNEINNLNAKISSYEEQLKEDTKGLWKHFKDLNRFNRQETVINTMKTLVDNEKHVIAAQLYEYTLKETPIHTSVKVSHRDGYVAEGEKLNALLQEHYWINHDIYTEFKKACNEIPNDKSSMFQFIEKNKSELDAKDINTLTGDVSSSVLYSLVLLGIQSFILLYSKENNLPVFSIDVVNSEDKEKILHDNKRTGILRGILNSELVNGDYYIFFHNGHNDKKGRIYFTKAIKISGQKYVFLVTLSRNIEKEVNWTQHIKRIENTFVEILNDNGLNVEYENKV